MNCSQRTSLAALYFPPRDRNPLGTVTLGKLKAFRMVLFDKMESREMFMKLVRTVLALFLGFHPFASSAEAQEQFDIVSFKSPGGWQRQEHPHAVSFSTERVSDGTFCLMTLLKALPASGSSEQNFQTVWETAVKEPFKVVGALDMQAPTTENGWTIESGWAEIEHDRGKALAMLVAASGGGKVVSLVIVTNTFDYQKEIDAFLASLKLPSVSPVAAQPPQKAPVKTAVKSKFKFQTTNFDNGWTAVEESDWVRASKGDTSALIHYPHPKEKETFYELETEARTFWDLLIAPRYSDLRDFEVLRSDRDFEPARYAAGAAAHQ